MGSSIGDALPGAIRLWEANAYAPERDEPEHVLVFGADAPFTRLTAAVPQPAESFPGETTRFGALARLVWASLLAAEVDVLP